MSFLPANARRVVVKVGTQTLTGGGCAIDPVRVQNLCTQVDALRRRDLEVIVVSSGAVGLGMGRLGLDRRPTDLCSLQACAAIGQTLMIETWRTGLERLGHTAAQILLTHEDVRGRKRHLSVRGTLERVLALGAVPIVNENDTVSADEIKFGDNDLLSALVASLLRADLLVLLTTARGLLDLSQDRLIPVVEQITPDIEALAGGTTSSTAVGGMTSKLAAARVAMSSGCGVFIGDGRSEHLLQDLLQGDAEGTFFVPEQLPMAAKKRWMAFFSRPSGTLHLDAGAVQALRHEGGSLLAMGITRTEGHYEEGDVVALAGPDGRVFARGRIGYGHAEVEAILGLSREAIREHFPRRRRLEVVHRDQLVLI